MLDTPILFLVFNRPDTTKRVFARIREIQPKQLFIAADGAREDREGEKEKTEEVRKLILDNIDWDCEVKTLFRDENLGCGKAVSEGITWFFEHVEQGIILEDDTLPDLSFFPFCEELLERYKSNEKIMHISGLNFQKKCWGEATYYFSAYSASIWGWATWKRSWEKYDFQIKELEFFLHSKTLNQIIPITNIANQYINNFKQVQKGKLDTWDYSWLFTLWRHQGLSIVPNNNMVINLGFSETDATHTTEVPHFIKNEIEVLETPLVHPNKIERHLEADMDRIRVKYLSTKPLSIQQRVLNKIKTIFNKL
jgi:hypothetical protein